MTILRLNVAEVINMAAKAGGGRVTRAAMLMAYGWNTSFQNADPDFHLPGFIQLIDAPREVTSEQMEAFRSDYRAWVVGNGFRELVSALEPILNLLHMLIAHSDCHIKGKRSRDADKACDRFERLGVWEKFRYLAKRHGIDIGLTDHYRTLTQARHCLTHRHGIVDDKDCDADGCLRIT